MGGEWRPQRWKPMKNGIDRKAQSVCAGTASAARSGDEVAAAKQGLERAAADGDALSIIQ